MQGELFNEGVNPPPAAPDKRLAMIPCKSEEECVRRQLDFVFSVGPQAGVVIEARAAAGSVGLLTRLWRWLVGADDLVKVGRFKLTETVAKHLGDVVKKGKYKGELVRPYLTSPHVIEEIMKAGPGVTDPGGVAGALRWDVPGMFRGAQGTWELVVSKSNTILHFNFVK